MINVSMKRVSNKLENNLQRTDFLIFPVEGKSPVCDSTNISVHVRLSEHTTAPTGRGVLGSSCAGYVQLASQNPYSIIVYSVAKYRPILVTFGQMLL